MSRDARGGAVVVVGSVNVDQLVVVEQLPRPGETVHAVERRTGFGGKGANQAVAAAQAGARTSLVACVGTDAEGTAALRRLQEQGVRVDGICRTGAADTGTALVAVGRRDRDNLIVVAHGANRHLRPDHVTRALGAASKDMREAERLRAVVVVNFEVPDDAIEAAAAAARRHGARLIVNPAPFRPLPRGLKGAGGILTPNQVEVAELLGLSEPEPLERDRLERGFRERLADDWGGLVVTAGPAGAIVVTADATTTVDAPVVTPVDTTGAGDVFTGALAAGVSRGLPLEPAARLAVRLATESTRHPGAQLEPGALEPVLRESAPAR